MRTSAISTPALLGALLSIHLGTGCSDPAVQRPDAGQADARVPDPRWQSLPDVGLGPVQEIGVAELDGKIYVVGGIDAGLSLLDAVQVYDVAEQSWSTVAPLPRPLHHANVAALDGTLYVLGGLIDSGFNETDECWAYDPGADAWTPLASMGAGARGSGAAAAVAGKIYLAGGWRNGSPVADFSAYDPVADTWDHTLPPLSGPRDHLVAAAADGLFYAISGRVGGIDALVARVDAYDPGTGEWSERAPIPTARGGMAVGVVDGRILVVGGEGADNGSGVFAEVESYDPASDSWTDLGVMATPRHGMGAAGYQGTLYVPGGADVRGFGAIASFESFTPTAQ